MSERACVPAYILAGGKSSRLGRDKTRVIVDGRVLIVRLSEQIAASGMPTNLVADRDDRFADLGLSCLVDAQSDAGPLAGLVTALEHRQQVGGDGWLLLMSCDAVQWDACWSDALLSQAKDEYSAVAFSRACGSEVLPEPMPGLYHTRLLDPAKQALHDGSRSLISLVQRAGWIDAGPSPAAQWFFNTEDELRQALQRL